MSIIVNGMLIELGLIRIERYDSRETIDFRRKMKSIGKEGRRRKRLGLRIMRISVLKKPPKKPLPAKSGNARM